MAEIQLSPLPTTASTAPSKSRWGTGTAQPVPVPPREPRPPRTPEEIPISLMAWLHVFASQWTWRWKFVHHYQKPGWVYDDANIYRHRDYADRIVNKSKSDRYLHHRNGKLRNLIVQCTDEIFRGPANTTWQRTYVRNASPLSIRIATWVVDFTDPESWEDWGSMLLRAFPAAFALLFCVRFALFDNLDIPLR
jgi:hypothetical protein